MKKTSERNLADFASHAYSTTAPRGYFVDEELSDSDRKVYYNTAKNDVVVAFRGTNPSNWRDLTTNAGMIAGRHKKLSRFQQSLDVTNRAVKKYGKQHITLTGHSLGGSQALYVHRKTGIKGSAFNPWVGIQEASGISGTGLGRIQRNFNIHSILGDVVSAGAMHLSNVHLYKPPNQAPQPASLHGISQFTSEGIHGEYVTGADSASHSETERPPVVGPSTLYNRDEKPEWLTKLQARPLIQQTYVLKAGPFVYGSSSSEGLVVRDPTLDLKHTFITGTYKPPRLRGAPRQEPKTTVVDNAVATTQSYNIKVGGGGITYQTGGKTGQTFGVGPLSYTTPGTPGTTYGVNAPAFELGSSYTSHDEF